jgi:putative FmdB family regulatory protein
MPIFDFICDDCQHVFESIVFRATEPIHCPKCSGGSVTKCNVTLFTCTEVQQKKRLKMESEGHLKKGREMLNSGKLRSRRVKIL